MLTSGLLDKTSSYFFRSSGGEILSNSAPNMAIGALISETKEEEKKTVKGVLVTSNTRRSQQECSAVVQPKTLEAESSFGHIYHTQQFNSAVKIHTFNIINCDKGRV